MARKMIQRILVSIPVMLGVVFLIFLMLNVVPGNPIEAMLGEHASQSVIDRMSRYYGLDQPVYVQFLIYVKNLLRGDLGVSYKLNRSVNDLIGSAFPYTLKLTLLSALLAWLIGIPAGIVSAIRKNSLIDRLFMGVSLMNLVPVSGATSLFSYFLPSIVLGWSSAGTIARLTRSNLLEVLEEDYIRTAFAKGRSQSGVILHHAFKNALLPVVTMMAIQVASMLSGAVITETVFAIPGIGRLAVDAITSRDMPLLQGTVLFTTVLMILGNLVADLLYTVIDPRIREI